MQELYQTLFGFLFCQDVNLLNKIKEINDK